MSPTPPCTRARCQATAASLMRPPTVCPVPCDVRTMRLGNVTPFNVNGVNTSGASPAFVLKATPLSLNAKRCQVIVFMALPGEQRKVVQVVELGRVGVWSGGLRGRDATAVADAAAELEDLGFGALWYPG